MQYENFDLNKVKTLSPNEAKQYVDKYFIPLTDGNHALLIDGMYEIYDDAVVKKTYFKRMSSELNKYYFQDKTDLKTIVYNINKPVLYDNFLNLCPRVKQTYKKPADFSADTWAKFNIILGYINEVLCSNRNDAYKFLLKWFANMIQGNRNDSALYLKGPQGAGKSTLLEFIRKYVLGNALCYQGGSAPLKNRFNSELSGKVMTVFEELENFSFGEWMAISSVLKRKITSPTLMIERKGKDAREETNLNNDILISNNDSIQDDEGRRYFILDILTKYINNKEYFNRLYSCFNDEVGQLFYSYMIDIDVKGFNSQSYPITKSKLDSFSKRLDSVYKYLKDVFILNKREIKRQTVQDLYDGYTSYCTENALKAKNKIDFNKTLEDINIKWKSSNGQNVYKVSYEELEKVADKFHWVHELDEYINAKNDGDFKPSVYIKEGDNAEYIRAEEYKQKLDKLQKINNTITESKEVLQDEFNNAIEYIKQLENILNNQETINKQHKEQNNNDDYVEIGNGILLNIKTNMEFTVADDLDDNDDLF